LFSIISSSEKELVMQFRLSSLIAVFTLCAIFCAIFFAVPLIVEIPLLAVIVLAAPSVWICGACFAKGPWRAFFLGGVCAGWLPHACLTYYGLFAGAELLDGVDFGGLIGTSEGEYAILLRLMIAGCFLSSGVLAFIGGGCGALVYHRFGRDPVTKPAAEIPRNPEPYFILESRITPLARPNEDVRRTPAE
jgi:hypothetical protein